MTPEERSITDASSCIYYTGDGLNALCEFPQQNEWFLLLLKKKPPIGINIFTDVDYGLQVVPDIRGLDYNVEIGEQYNVIEATYTYSTRSSWFGEFNAVHSITSVVGESDATWKWPTPLTEIFTRCWISRNDIVTNWTVACFVNDTSHYVSDQIDYQNALHTTSVVTPETVNYVHSTYTWDFALNTDEMKVVTAALRYEIGGIPFADSINITPITLNDFEKYKLRRSLTLGMDIDPQVDSSDYCVACPSGTFPSSYCI
jgi:hypothetical protein